MATYSPQGFSMFPKGVKNLLIINILIFLATWVAEMRGLGHLVDPLCLYPLKIGYLHPFTYTMGFHFWQPFTYMFLHAGWDHLFFNMFALWMFGYILENYWGTRRFLIFYILCGIGAAFTHMAMSILLNMPPVPTVGASGAIYGILLAFGMMFPNERIYLYFLLPIKAKWFVIIYALIELFEGVFRSGDGVAHFAHLGGMLVGLILILLWRQREKRQDRWRRDY